MSNKQRLRALGRAALPLAVLLPMASLMPAVAQGAALREFTASYAVTWRGMSAGKSEAALRHLEGTRWSYVSKSNAQGVFRLALSSELSQHSTFDIRDGRVVPLHFENDDGTDDKGRDQDLRFDWNSRRITGTAEGNAVEIPIEPGTLVHDAMSLQVAMMMALADGQAPERALMVDKTKIKEYVYDSQGEETISTPMGPKKTVVLRSSRPGNSRGTWFWCAPDLGYLPVKVERRNGKKVEWSMSLLSAQMGPAP